MGESLSNLVAQLRALSPGRQAVLALTALGSLAFFAWLAAGAAKPEQRVLYRGLAEDEVARVTEGLRAERIDYQLDEGGTAVLVPASQVYEARIRLAGKGLPSGGATGFEIFDKPAFGVTDFVHHVNYSRALSGELARSVEQLDPVERARVQVVIPERRSVLAAAQRKPRAAVIVRLRPGHQLRPDQVQAVVHLVASSVESLDTADVTVVDGAGHLLAPQGDALPSGTLPVGGAPGYQQRVEAELARRVEAILEKTVGVGGVIARVRADMDWTESETTEETFDPDSQVARSEQRSSESSEDGMAQEEGVPGVASNAPDAVAAAATPAPSRSTSTRSDETLNYEINKKVSHRRTPMGGIRRLSVAVLVADRPAAEADGEPQRWSSESLSLFESLAKQAVGFDEKRGDQITISSAPFRMPEQEVEDGGGIGPEWILLAEALLRALSVLLVVLAFGKMVVGPVARSLGQARAESGASLPATVAQLDGEGAAAGALPEAAAPGALAAGSAPAAPPIPQEDGVRAIRNWLNQS